jgi:hypothetical protein
VTPAVQACVRACARAREMQHSSSALEGWAGPHWETHAPTPTHPPPKRPKPPGPPRNQPVDAAGRGLRYRGMLDCLLQSARSEGPLALWKGWGPSCARLGPHTCISLLIFERLRQAAGLSPI